MDYKIRTLWIILLIKTNDETSRGIHKSLFTSNNNRRLIILRPRIDHANNDCAIGLQHEIFKRCWRLLIKNTITDNNAFKIARKISLILIAAFTLNQIFEIDEPIRNNNSINQLKTER